MAKELVPDELWMVIDPLLTPEPPKPNGGRPRVPDRATLDGIIYVKRESVNPAGTSRVPKRQGTLESTGLGGIPRPF
jgi:hypothetical protein